MANLNNQLISTTFQWVLNIGGTLTTTPLNVTDGLGNDTGLRISTSGMNGNVYGNINTSATPPTTSTVGILYQPLLVGTASPYQLWFCIAISGSTYTWVQASSSQPATSVFFDPAFFTGTGTQQSPITIVANSIGLGQLSASAFDVPNGIPKLDSSTLIKAVELPVATASVKGAVKPDGTSTTVSADGSISATPATQAQVYTQDKVILVAGANVTLQKDDVANTITINASGSAPTPIPFDYSLTATWADGSVSKAFYTSEASISYLAVATNGNITGTVSIIGVQNGANIFTATTATGTQAITDFVDAITINASIQGTGTQGAGQITVSKSTQLTVFSPIFYFCGTQPNNVQTMVSLGIAPQATNTFQVASGTVGGNIYFATTGTVTAVIQQGFSVSFVRVGSITYTPGNVTYNLWQMTGATYASPFSITLNIQ